MKNIAFLAVLGLLFSSCAYKRIGDLNVVSNRNIESSKKYVLIERNATAKAKAKGREKDALERALDVITKEYNGEYLMNAKIYVKNNGKKAKIEGDVWGFESAIKTKVEVEASVTKKIEFKTGDSVTFKSGGKLVEGKIIGINKNGAVVEYQASLKQTKKKEVPFDALTKID